jgi:ribosomal protein S18 acetylase RimI-like enzyme
MKCPVRSPQTTFTAEKISTITLISHSASELLARRNWGERNHQTVATTRPATRGDVPELKLVIESCGLFPPEILGDMMAGHLDGSTEASEFWLVVADSSSAAPIGVAYCALEKLTNGTWNVLVLAVDAKYQRRGLGAELMKAVETELQRRTARLVLVETSSTDEYAKAQNFIKKIGFVEEGRVRHYYDEDFDPRSATPASASKSHRKVR